MTYSAIYEARQKLGPIQGLHKAHEGVKPSTGNIIGAKGYYSACIRGHKARIDCAHQFWPQGADNDGYLSDYDLKMLPRYVPQYVKNHVKSILKAQNNLETLCLVIVRHNRNGQSIYCGAFLVNSKDNVLLYADRSKPRYEALLDAYEARILPKI